MTPRHHDAPLRYSSSTGWSWPPRSTDCPSWPRAPGEGEAHGETALAFALAIPGNRFLPWPAGLEPKGGELPRPHDHQNYLIQNGVSTGVGTVSLCSGSDRHGHHLSQIWRNRLHRKAVCRRLLRLRAPGRPSFARYRAVRSVVQLCTSVHAVLCALVRNRACNTVPQCHAPCSPHAYVRTERICTAIHARCCVQGCCLHACSRAVANACMRDLMALVP